MVIVGEDIRIDAVVFESNRTDNWVYSFNTFSRLEACKKWGWEEEEKEWEEKNSQNEGEEGEKKGRADEAMQKTREEFARKPVEAEIPWSAGVRCCTLWRKERAHEG